MSEQVPTNGFAVPPIPQNQSLNPAPQVPSLQGLVPPAPAPAQEQPQQQPQQNADLVALLQGFLKQPQGQQPQVQEQEQAVEFDASEASELAEDDPLANSMLSVIGVVAPSIDIERFLSKALLANDASLIDVAYVQEKFPQSAQQLLTIARGLIDHSKAQGARREAAVHAAAGGKENWTAAAAVFRQSAPPAIKQIAQVLFERGQDVAAAQLVVGFSQQSGALASPGTFVQGGGANFGGQALDKATFQTELRKLNPNEVGYEQKRADLFARRQQGKALGR